MLAQTNAAYQATFILRNIDNSPFDLTGAFIRMQFKSVPGVAAALTATTDDMLSIGADPTLGRLALLVPTATMRGLTPGTYFFDAVKEIEAESYLLFRGKWTVLPGITDDPSLTLPPLQGRLQDGDAITVIVAASELQVSVGGASPPANGLLDTFDGPPPPPLTGARMFFDLSDNLGKVILADGTVFPLSGGTSEGGQLDFSDPNNSALDTSL